MTAVSTIMPSSTHERVSKLLLLMSSPVDNEVVSAARALDRTLRADGRDWHMLVASIRTAPRRTQPETMGGHWNGWHWRSAAKFCASHGEYLNAWEADFIHNILQWRRTPTQKQLDCLEAIRQRILQQRESRCRAPGAARTNI
jgi:hypothetical protein